LIRYGSGGHKRPVCALEELIRDGTRTVAGDTDCPEFFLVADGGAVRAYVNSCPHTGAPLNWLPNQFLSLDGRHIQCANHLALFRIDDGRCVHGPCMGQGLTSVAVDVREGNVWLGGDDPEGGAAG
jgi:nitrite reductase/ring-hydroxylating ferredoxin subunit